MGRQREEGKGVGQKEIGRVGGWVDRERGRGRVLGRQREEGEEFWVDIERKGKGVV